MYTDFNYGQNSYFSVSLLSPVYGGIFLSWSPNLIGLTNWIAKGPKLSPTKLLTFALFWGFWERVYWKIQTVFICGGYFLPSKIALWKPGCQNYWSCVILTNCKYKGFQTMVLFFCFQPIPMVPGDLIYSTHRNESSFKWMLGKS